MATDSKQYIIDLLAQLHGRQVVISGLEELGGATIKIGKQAKEASTGTQSFVDILDKVAVRALLVAPIWMAIRSAMLLVLDTIKLMINANLELETSMANIQTTLRGSAQSIQIQSNAIKELIISMRSPLSGKELGEAFIELNKVLQDTATSYIALKSAETLSVTTGLQAKEAGSLLAKTYNELGNTMDASLTTAEKFQKITDILVYTTKTQGVEIKDLAQGYSKLAPFLTGTSDKFEDVITLLGFLSTHFVEGGRAGQSLSTELVNIQKNAKTLAEAFHIQLNPNELMSIIGTFREIGEEIKSTGKISNEQSLAISQVFGGARTSSPVRETVANIERLVNALDDAKEHAGGFAEKTKAIVEHTTVEQFKELQKTIGDLVITFSTPFGDTFVKLLSNVNDYLILIRPNIEGLGVFIAFLTDQVGRSVDYVEKVIHGKFKELPKGNEGTFERFVNDYLKTKARLDADSKKPPVKPPEIPETDTKHIESLKEEAMYTKEIGKALEDAGVKESQILQWKLAQYEANSANKVTADYETKIEQLKLEIVGAQLKEERKVTEEKEKRNVKDANRDALNYIKESGTLLSALGADESQILEIKIKELELDSSIKDEETRQLELNKLKYQQIVAIAKEKQREDQIETSLAVRYAQSDEMERARIRRLAQLRTLSTENLVGMLNRPYEADIIEKNMHEFSMEQQKAIGQALNSKFHIGLTSPLGGMTNLPTDELKKLSGGASMFWDEWESRKRSALDSWGKEFSGTIRNAFGEINPFKNSEYPGFNPATMEKRITIDPMTVNLNINTKDMSIDQIKNAIKNAVNVEFDKKENLDKIANHTLNEYNN